MVIVEYMVNVSFFKPIIENQLTQDIGNKFSPESVKEYLMTYVQMEDVNDDKNEIKKSN